MYRKRKTLNRLTHVDEHGRARVVDVSRKPVTLRQATAQGAMRMRRETFRLLHAGRLAKGDAFTVAKLAGIMAAKRTHELIPLCHPLAIDAIALQFESVASHNRVLVTSTVRSRGRTGVEMEALTACAAALLTLYDMCKSAERGIVIEEIKLLSKSGGASGPWNRR